jgi:hypothetical protein
MILSPTVDNNLLKVSQYLHNIATDEVNTFKITLKNTTASTLLKLLNSNRELIGQVAITSGEGIYEIELTNGYWTGDLVGLTLNFGNIVKGGSIEIEKIEFCNPNLSNEDIAKDDVQLSIYPNPVGDMLSVKASTKINSLQIYNVTGQEVLRASKASINTSSLSEGVYILKVLQEDGVISTKRFVKE